MADVPIQLPTIEKVQALGVNVSNTDSLRNFYRVMRIIELKMTGNHNGWSDAASKEFGVTRDWVMTILATSPYTEIAAKLVAESLIQRLIDGDARNQMMKLYQENYLGVLGNLARIAQGQRAQGETRPPPHIAQVAAAKAFLEARVGEAFVQATFLSNAPESESSPFLDAQQKLKASTPVRLDENVVEAE